MHDVRIQPRADRDCLLQVSPSGPSRESLKTPSRPESRVALNKTESLKIESSCILMVKGDKYSLAKWVFESSNYFGIFFGSLV